MSAERLGGSRFFQLSEPRSESDSALAERLACHKPLERASYTFTLKQLA